MENNDQQNRPTSSLLPIMLAATVATIFASVSEREGASEVSL